MDLKKDTTEEDWANDGGNVSYELYQEELVRTNYEHALTILRNKRFESLHSVVDLAEGIDLFSDLSKKRNLERSLAIIIARLQKNYRSQDIRKSLSDVVHYLRRGDLA